jgi:carboxylesterase type B/2',3'-cyclic-nucleotide 2'-phosphodiesterase (5'-nucleotidase family)
MQTCKLTKYVLVICLVLIGSSFLAGCTQKEPVSGIVKTDAGSVSGINQDGLRVYLGIPFAAPPTGELRWRPPAPVQPWDGVKETTAYAAACPQPGSTAPLNMSEDCLYLNVWTPAQSADEKLPVMVFFYGGGFKEVAFSMPAYNGTTLAQKGVIVVTPNYRLGALGFLAHPGLDAESPHNASGNYGILDQQAALAWVQRNIGAFGGDPSRVTIFGQSAGAESVLVHVASPTSKGLFRQAIVESGPFWAQGAIINATHSKADAEQSGVAYAESLGYSGPDAIAQMRRLSPEALINATPSPSAGFWTTHAVLFEPTVDGWVLPDTMDNIYLAHRENPVPLMIGNNANDGTTLSAGANMTVPEYTAFLTSRFGKDADAVLAKYPAATPAEVQLRLSQIMTDYDFSGSVKYAAGSMGDIGPDTYMYRYSYILPGQANGAFHGSETLLLFGLPVPADPAVRDTVVDLWTRFAKTGNPNGGMNVTWPDYTRGNGQYLDINVTPTVVGGPAPAPQGNATVHVQILAVNDFHGHLSPGQTLNSRPVGGAPVLASYLRSAMASGNADGTIIALPGDVVGSSPPSSGLLLDEPSLLFFNSFANQYCTIGSGSPSASCNMVATLGNQEFNGGIPELMRKINGGNGATTITHLVDPYPGAKFDYVCANVVWTANNTPVLPPYTVRNVGGVPIAFIGAVTKTTPLFTNAANVEGVSFLDEADSINRYVPEIRSKGIHAIVVLLHEGGNQAPYEGPTQADGAVSGTVTQIVPRLDPDVDVVLSAHTHEFTNAFLNNSGGRPVLVTQAYMYSRGYADLDLTIDRASGGIVEKSARIVPAYADQAPGTSPDPAATAFLAEDQDVLGPVENRTIGEAAMNITLDENPAGESALGDLVADAERAAMNADVGFETPGDIFANVSQGTITWNDLYRVQPAAGTVLSSTMSGRQIRQVLEQQWQPPLPADHLIVSGLAYTYDAAAPAGSRVTSVTVHGAPLDPATNYTVSMVGYLAMGSDGYTALTQGTNVTYGPPDIDALVNYMESLPQPVNATVDGRVTRIN